MSTANQGEPRIKTVTVTDEAIVAHLTDGRTISVPLAWSWRLSDATPKERSRWEIIGDGQGIHWPDVDEDISMDGMLRGIPAKRPSRSLGRRVGQGRQFVARELWQCIDRLDYGLYFKQAVLLPQEPMTYRP
jgi:hypothetical protein